MKQQISASQAGQQVSGKSGVRTRHLRDLPVWQKAMLLAKDVYRKTERFPKTEGFGITSQIRRGLVSVPSNIAEGRGRHSDGSMRFSWDRLADGYLNEKHRLDLHAT